ncbi:MAG: amidohydrolase family protein, partial [Myxococcota bacterium]
EQDPIVDCFARVENMPKHVLRKAADKATWRTSGEYLQHFEDLALGPNVVPLIPQSMLRIEAMGLKNAVSRAPTKQELGRMEQLVEQAMKEGYVGLSTDALPFHYLSNDPNRQKKIPAQHGSFSELRRLTNIVRKFGRVWQATPPKDSPLDVIRTFILTSGRLFGRPLKLTAVAALDVATNRGLAQLGLFLTRILNSKLLKGHFRLQALAAPFKVYAEGPLTPLAEEIPELRRLNEPDLEDRASRQAIMQDPVWRKAFKRMWGIGKRGFGLARIKRWLKREDLALSRDLDEMFVHRCPVTQWEQESLGDVYRRFLQWRANGQGARSDAERETFEAAPTQIDDDGDFFLFLLERFDTDLYWWTVTANRDPRVLKRLLTDAQILPGFNDSGAHLTNMAFYDTNLRGLRLVADDGMASVARHVRRLSAEPAEFFDLDVGRIETGWQADLVLIDPQALRTYDGEAHVTEVYREDFQHVQLVNRSDGVVPGVWIRGQRVWDGKAFHPSLGTERLGRCLTATKTSVALSS